MSASGCGRRWEVEAERDGRLRGSDLQSALRHRAQCGKCTAEARALAKLGQRLRSVPSAASDPMATRRARQRLLSRWNSELLRGPPPPRVRRGTLVFGFAAGLAAIGALALGLRAIARRTEPAVPPSVLTVEGAPGARWREQLSASSDRVELSYGVAAFSVRPHGRRRVVIALPDGEIEDLGTVFQVEVSARRTERVAVREGRVSVRLNGLSPFELRAGESWSAALAPPSTASASPPASTSPPEGAREPAASAQPVAAQKRTKARPVPALPAAPPLAANSAEDDAYLHIVELLRSGHGAEAQSQAEQYLVRFPNGFRRPEVERVLSH